MAILTPHQSQAGIATANAGQVAPFRSASAFMTPGQAALPSGLNQLARGAERLGEAVFRAGLDRMKLQNATDLLADKVAYEDALRKFDSGYRKTHLGASARDAEEAYSAFHKEQYDRLQKKWGGNAFLMEGVDRMAEGIRLPSMQKAVNYRDGQEEAYKKSVLQSSQAQTFALWGDSNATQEEKDAALDAEERNLRMFAGQTPVEVDGKIEWQGGTDVGAEIMALRQKAAALNVDGFLARKDVAGAQHALDMAGGGTVSAPGSLSARNLAANNFGNVKNTKGNFVAYATRQDGLMGLGERPLRYANAPEKGWHAESLLDMVKIYAPKGDGGNDPENYAAFLGKKLGIDPKAKINFRDPKILAGLIQWMPVMEHGAQQVKISDAEAMQAAQALLAGQKPNIVGEAAKKGDGAVPAGASPLLSPAQREKYQAQIDTLQEKQAVDGFLAETGNMPTPERLAALDAVYGNDPAKRVVHDAARQGIFQEDRAREAERAMVERDILRANIQEMVKAAELPPEQSFREMQRLREETPLEKRAEFDRIANNLRNPGRHDDKQAIEEITQRQLAGEEFDIRAEYGSRLTPATVQKLESKAYREALPPIKTAFDDAANEWLADDKNKKAAGGMGVGNRTALWTNFLDQTDADEKKDYARLRREAGEFFKKVILEKPGFFYNSDVETVQGLVPRVLVEHPGAFPRQGTEDYGAVTAALKEANIPPKGMWGGYTDEQLAKGYTALREQRKGGGK